MSKLLDDLRSEQEHYERAIHGDGRAENIKRIADHIEYLEEEISKYKKTLTSYNEFIKRFNRMSEKTTKEVDDILEEGGGYEA